MTQPSKTPRTDIRKFRKGDLYDPSTKAGTLYVSSETEFVEAGFCAAIERELSTARSMLADLERQFGKLLAQPNAAPQPSIVASAHLLTEQDTHLLAAYTPERYAGDYPEYWNLTMVRMKGDVILTVRLPTSFRQPPGATSCVRFTRELWREFNKQFAKANEVFEAADFLDAIL